MAYYINPKNLTSCFFVPNCVSDEHLKLSTHTQLKVLIYFLCNKDSNDSAKISNALSIAETEAEDALKYWTQLGVLMSDNEVNAVAATTTQSVVRNEKPSRADVIKRGNEDRQVMFLLREAQIKFGRSLKSNESSCLLWLYDDLGLDISVILMLLQYAVAEGRINISFIEKTAVDWANKGVATLSDAEREIAELARKKTAWNMIMNVFGIERRQPSDKELMLCDRWVNDWKMSKPMLKAAYDVCIDSKAKLSMAYINKILESWYKGGIKTVEDIAATGRKKSKSDTARGATYDLELFEKMINSDD